MEDLQFIHKNGNKNLILFIHGFQSDSKTWVNKNGKSFPNLLKSSTEISGNFDIATFDYYTKLADFYSLKVIRTGILRLIGKQGVLSLRNLSITKLGDYLRTVVDINCDNYKNIIIIAHSMGGLVAKSYILQGINASSSKVKMFFSLAVPHGGSDWATYGKMLFRDHDQLIDLHPLNERVHKLNNDWIQTKNELPKTLYFFGFDDIVVTESSAVGFEKNKQLQYGFRSDHHLISKPESNKNEVYKAVEKILLKFIYDDQRIPIENVISQYVKLGNRVWATREGNEISKNLYNLCREHGELFTINDLKTLIFTKEEISRTGIIALSILYEKYPEYIKSLDLPNVFEEAWQVSYYCKLKEKYLSQDLSLLLFDKDKIDWEIDGVTLFTDIDLHDKWITRGDSIFVEFSYSTESEDNDE